LHGNTGSPALTGGEGEGGLDHAGTSGGGRGSNRQPGLAGSAAGSWEAREIEEEKE